MKCAVGMYFIFVPYSEKVTFTAKQRGLTFLEKCLHEISDAYALSIVTYALALLKRFPDIVNL